MIWLTSALTNVVTWLVMFGVLVFFHELGHFSVAKAFRMRVNEFALGMGLPKWRIAYDGETEYTIRAFPIGGFVRIHGMEIEDSVERKLTGADDSGPVDADAQPAPSADPRGYNSRPLYERFLVILAGPAFSLLFGYFSFCLLTYLQGVPTPTNRVETVLVNSPADKHHIKPGDAILAVNGIAIHNVDELINVVQSSYQVSTGGAKPLNVEVKHVNGAVEDISVTPAVQTENGVSIPRIGVTLDQDFRPAKSLGECFRQGAADVASCLASIWKIIATHQLAQNIGGPVSTFKIVNQAREQAGGRGLLETFGLLSVSIGLFNLLPIPVLDGGYLAMMTVELVRRRKLGANQMQYALATGLALLAILFVCVTVKDLIGLRH